MYILIAVVSFTIVLVIYYNNKLVSRKNQVENAFGTVDAMLKKRYDLIPNLVDSVKSYMVHEKDVLLQLTDLRAKAIANNLTGDQKVKLNNEITTCLDKIVFSAENYPDLKAGENFIQLQMAWNDVEENIAASRRFYNSAVTDYNDTVEKFPTNYLAKALSYSRKSVFEISSGERKNLNAKELFAKS